MFWMSGFYISEVNNKVIYQCDTWRTRGGFMVGWLDGLGICFSWRGFVQPGEARAAWKPKHHLSLALWW